MADSEEQQQVSSSTPLFSEGHHYQAEPEPEPQLEPGPKQDLFTPDDIVDLVGGAQDALERHRAEEESGLQVSSVTSTEPVQEPEPEPEIEEKNVLEPEPEPQFEKAVPDSTSFSFCPEEPEVVAPRAEPESSELGPAPPVEPPAPQSDALHAAAAREAAPSPAEAAEQPAVTQEPVAPASLVELLYWRDVKTTGVVFGASLLLLLSLTVCSIVSVCSYIGLALLSVTICFRIYKGILQAIQKSDEGHPFKQYLDQEVALSDDTVHKYSDVILEKLNKTIEELRRLFLVEDLVDSIKFAVLMWILTYVGALFNGLTLLILGLIGAFSCPIIYEKHQAQIDHYLALVNNQIKDVVGKVQAKVPGLKRKAD
ncbi:reticulon-1-A-like isoform X4 [Girardinichthys multiradiatus]|uniref:reticulon-1-A-like isoform X4 n=1 Tax=Girardinichthys multiradiatus TaxID=208333 RepID=UPI001FACE6BA|nr:reticulon-1-A-like isoform X4 [Girardinichthys multiradiatus]